MPQNLPQQILQRIVRLSADGNSQREVARMLGMSQGYISKILQRNRETCRPNQRKRGGSMKFSTPWEDRQLLRMVRTNHFISAPRLQMQMIHRFGRRVSVRTIRRWILTTGYWSRRTAKCPRLTFEHRWRRHERARSTECGTSDNGDTIFSDESRFSQYHSDGWVRVRRRQWERLINARVQPNDGNRGPSVMVWGAIHHGGRSELIVVDGAMNRHRYIQILRNQMLPSATGVFGRYFVFLQDNAPLIQHVARQPFSNNRMLRSWTGQPGVQTWTQFSKFGIKCQSGSETWMTPSHHSWTKQFCPPGTGCSLARKGADPGREHASSCQGSSGG